MAEEDIVESFAEGMDKGIEEGGGTADREELLKGIKKSMLEGNGKALLQKLTKEEAEMVGGDLGKGLTESIPDLGTDSEKAASTFDTLGNLTDNLAEKATTESAFKQGFKKLLESIKNIKGASAKFFKAIKEALGFAEEKGPVATADRMEELANADSAEAREARNKMLKYVGSRIVGGGVIIALWQLGGREALEDLFKELGNGLSELSKRLLGALEAIGVALAKPIGAGLGSGIKMLITIIGVCAGIGLIGFVIAKIIASAKKKKKTVKAL